MLIGENLKKVRDEAGLSQTDLAKVSGVSQQLISQIERGINAHSKHLPKLARALGCKVTDLDPTYFDEAPLTEAEHQLVSLYRKANPDLRKTLLLLLEQARTLPPPGQDSDASGAE